MSAPYRDHIAAIRAALNVDARSLYKPSGWQALATIGYREELPPAPGELSKLDRFQQDCLTYAALNHRMPAAQWAVLIVWHSLRITDPKEQRTELDRLRWATWTAAGHTGCDDVEFSRWAALKWGGKLGKGDGWARWEGGSVAVSTRKRHYREQVAMPLDALLTVASHNAARILADIGLVEREAA
jgi:hypothetical protein